MKIVIIGGVAGGASAATRCRRLSEDAEIVLFERGQYISFANCGLPYYIGNEIKKRKTLLRSSPDLFKSRYNINVHTLHEVISINRMKRTVSVINHTDGTQHNESYDKLILSPGVKPFKPIIPGIDSDRIFVLRNIPDMDLIDEAIKKYNGKRAVVVGGGFIGLEIAENIQKRGYTVSIVEILDQVMSNLDKEIAVSIHNHLKEKNIELHLNNAIKSFKTTDTNIIVKLKDETVIEGDIVVLSAGVLPESNLAEGCGLDLGLKKTIKVNKFMQTSDPNIYAIGDVVEVNQIVNETPAHIPLAGPAVKQARIAADHIFNRTSAYHGSQGTSICKIFDLTAASTGLNEKSLKKSGVPYDKVYIVDPQHVSYYPGATPILFKLIFNKDSGKILGAQAVGENGVDKRIDIISIAIQGGMTVFDLQESELNYAPPYGAPKDIINMAGFAASNSIRGDVNIIHWDVLDEMKKATAFLLDVRSPFEFQLGNVEGSSNINVNELRQNIDKLANHKDKTIYVYCHSGYRSYIACRILKQLNFNAKNISGGYTLYKYYYPDD